MEFKDRIKALRVEHKITSTELASKFGKTESAVRAWELGRTKPDADTLIELARYFNCTTDYLLGVSDIKSYAPDKKDVEIHYLRTKIELIEKILLKIEMNLRETLDNFKEIVNVSESIRALEQSDMDE